MPNVSAVNDNDSLDKAREFQRAMAETFDSRTPPPLPTTPWGWDETQIGSGTMVASYEQERDDEDSGPDTVTLDPSDPFDAALIPLVVTNRKKRADYAHDSDPFTNFRETARAVGLDDFTEVDSARFNIAQKMARITSLKANGRTNNPSNEAVEDSYLDMAVYAIIAYALVRERKKNSE